MGRRTLGQRGYHPSAGLQPLALSPAQGQMPRDPLMQLSMEDPEVADERLSTQLAGWITLPGSHASPIPVPAPGETPHSPPCSPLSVDLHPKQSWQSGEDGKRVLIPAPPRPSCLCFSAIHWGQCHRPISHFADSFPCSGLPSFPQ